MQWSCRKCGGEKKWRRKNYGNWVAENVGKKKKRKKKESWLAKIGEKKNYGKPRFFFFFFGVPMNCRTLWSHKGIQKYIYSHAHIFSLAL